MLSRASIDLIKRWEGKELKAYKDSGGVWTIGYGHTSMAGPPQVVPGLVITAQEAEDIFRRDLVKYENTVKSSVKVPLNDNEYGALVSLCYNIGQGAFAKSTLVKKLNAKDYKGAADQFLVWVKDNGKTVQGLVNRRKDEKKHFLTPAGVKAPVSPVQPVKPPVAPQVPSKPEAPVEAPQGGFWARLIEFIAKLFKRK